ncbi:MAG TPA: peptidoglycan recognition family protein [Actinomycetota bacterium]|nr:peptidoglycan recognition family protein [Actinomycetota bacterium]
MTVRLSVLVLLLVPGLVGGPGLDASPLHRSSAAIAATEPREPDVASLRPPIVWKPIPYGERRRQQMGAYSERHYGRWRWRLRRKLAIVEHYTTGTTWQGAWNLFAANTKHLDEYPGTCAHFIVHTDGTIYQLVPLSTRCRHTIGLNQLSIGIEHVGRSDAEVLGNARQMDASLRLTLWLVAKYGLEIRNVIGHAESLRSPLRFERYPAWRCRTHADMAGPAMSTYRGRLRDRARAAGVPIGPAPEWVDIGC